MNNRTTAALLGVLFLALISIFVVVFSTDLSDFLFWRTDPQAGSKFNLGLDLQGGIQVLLAPDETQTVTAEKVDDSRSIIEERVNALGLTEPIVQVRGGDRIIVELPGISDEKQAVDTIRGTGLLEFIESSDILLEGTPVSTTYGLKEPSEIAAALAMTTTKVYSTVMTGESLVTAKPAASETGGWEVTFELKPDAATFFANYTASHIGRPLCMVLDKKIVSCPTIRSAIPNGTGSISGNYTHDEANALAIKLRYGALPLSWHVESSKSVGATLGQESVSKSIRAGTIGLLIVFLFMLVYYRLNGVSADLALGLYVLLNLMLYKLFPITLTLPGIAGFLLSAGMAVDANILVFERMKEELRHGRSFGTAVDAGFARAWTSVLDSNLATLLTCGVLYVFGNAFAASMVQGFAVTLALGTLINLFTALVVTRAFVRTSFHLFGEKVREEKPWLLGI